MLFGSPLSGFLRRRSIGLGSEFEELMEMFEDAEGMYEAATQELKQSFRPTPKLIKLAADEIKGRLRTIENMILSEEAKEDNRHILDLVKGLRTKLNKTMAEVKEDAAFDPVEPDYFQKLLLTRMLTGFKNMKQRWTNDKNIANMKMAKSMLRMDTFKNRLLSRETALNRKLNAEERKDVWASIGKPDERELNRFRAEASVRIIQKTMKAIDDRISQLAKTNPYEAEVFRRTFEAIQRIGI